VRQPRCHRGAGRRVDSRNVRPVREPPRSHRARARPTCGRDHRAQSSGP
jgi:hypothetical protein